MKVFKRSRFWSKSNSTATGNRLSVSADLFNWIWKVLKISFCKAHRLQCNEDPNGRRVELCGMRPFFTMNFLLLYRKNTYCRKKSKSFWVRKFLTSVGGHVDHQEHLPAVLLPDVDVRGFVHQGEVVAVDALGVVGAVSERLGGRPARQGDHRQEKRSERLLHRLRLVWRKRTAAVFIAAPATYVSVSTRSRFICRYHVIVAVQWKNRSLFLCDTVLSARSYWHRQFKHHTLFAMQTQTQRNPFAKPNQKGRICFSPISHWLRFLGYVGSEFTLQMTYWHLMFVLRFFIKSRIFWSWTGFKTWVNVRVQNDCRRRPTSTAHPLEHLPSTTIENPGGMMMLSWVWCRNWMVASLKSKTCACKYFWTAKHLHTQSSSDCLRSNRVKSERKWPSHTIRGLSSGIMTWAVHGVCFLLGVIKTLSGVSLNTRSCGICIHVRLFVMICAWIWTFSTAWMKILCSEAREPVRLCLEQNIEHKMSRVVCAGLKTRMHSENNREVKHATVQFFALCTRQNNNQGLFYLSLWGLFGQALTFTGTLDHARAPTPSSNFRWVPVHPNKQCQEQNRFRWIPAKWIV